MRNILKWEYCIECANKCKNHAKSILFANMLATTVADAALCHRKYKRALKHANKYVDLARYYGGK